MAVAVRAVGTIASGTGTISPGLPSGTTAGDFLLMICETQVGGLTVSGWTEAPLSAQGDLTSATQLQVFYKVAAGGDATTTNDSGNHQGGRIIGFTGVDTTNPFNIYKGSSSTTNDTAGSIPGGVTTKDGCMIVAACCSTIDNGSDGTGEFASWTNANLASITEQIDDYFTAGSGGAIGAATGIKTSAGDYGTTTVTYGHNSRKGLWSCALNPANVAPTVALNSPSDAGTVSTTTPTVNFTGTDTESGDIRYEVQIGTSTFGADIALDTSAQAVTKVASNNISASLTVGGGSNRCLTAHVVIFDATGADRIVSGITWNTSENFTKIRADELAGGQRTELWQLVNPTTGAHTATVTMAGVCANLDLAVASWTGVDQSSPTDGSDTATASAATSISKSLTPTRGGGVLIDAVATAAQIATKGGEQTILLDKSSSESLASYQLTSPKVSYTNAYYFDSDDAVMSVALLKSANTPLIDVVSGTDAGFAGSPDNSDPFASAQAVDYTVQAGSALTDTVTYYWRVKGGNPLGSTIYGAWATTRSFTVSVGGGGGGSPSATSFLTTNSKFWGM